MNDLTAAEGSLAVPGRGFEMKIDRADLIIPRGKLLQALSPEVAERGMKAGQIINSLTAEVLPSRMIPIFCFKNYFRFNPRKREDPHFLSEYAPGALIWRSANPDDPKVLEETQFGQNGELPAAMTCLNFFSLFLDVPMPIIVSFSKTSYRAGKQLLSLARFCGGDMWSRAYQLTASLQNTDKGTYYVLNVSTLGASTDAERTQAEAWWKAFSDKATEIKVHDDENVDADAIDV